MPTLKGTEASLFYVQCFLYLVPSSISISIFHITWLDTFLGRVVDRGSKIVNLLPVNVKWKMSLRCAAAWAELNVYSQTTGQPSL